MCNFLSWKEKEGEKPLFLDDDDLASEKGRELKEYLGSAYDEDKKGHGAITWWYPSSKDWKHKECEDFSDPKNFPIEIVEKIKLGKFSQFGVCEEILNKYGKQELARCQKADADYQKADADRQKAYADCQKADADCQKADADCQKADADYQKAYADYQKAYADRQKAYADCQKAYADYQKAYAKIFWQIAVQKKYRVKAWKRNGCVYVEDKDVTQN